VFLISAKRRLGEVQQAKKNLPSVSSKNGTGSAREEEGGSDWEKAKEI